MNSRPAVPPGPGEEVAIDVHLERSISALRKVHQDHEEAKSRLQKSLDRVTNIVGTPLAVGALILLVCLWIVSTLILNGPERLTPDLEPFLWLELFAAVFAMLITLVILTTQRRQERLAEQRADLTLQLALLSDQKNAKIIALLEELRRDSPNVANRPDQESEDMARPADPQTVLAALAQAEGPEESPD